MFHVLIEKARIRATRQRFPYEKFHYKHNCLFIHIPKVAGTSILHFMGKKIGGRNHIPWYIYLAKDPAFYKTAFKFAFVRNPYDRLLSAYNYLITGGNGGTDLILAKDLAIYKTFESFVLGALAEGKYRSNVLYLPQSIYIVDGSGEVVVDYLGRYENIKSDFANIATKIGVSGELPQLNKSSYTYIDYRKSYLSNEVIEMVASIYREDIVKFGYAFE